MIDKSPVIASRHGVVAYLWVEAMTTQWELARARRVNRLIAFRAIEAAGYDPFERPWRMTPGTLVGVDPEINYAVATTSPVLREIFPDFGTLIDAYDRDEVGRRALVQVLAIRIWQLRHDGSFPGNLDALVPAELPNLPRDPYTGRPFAFLSSNGLKMLPFRFTLDGTRAWGEHMPAKIQAGSWLLASAGDLERPAWSGRDRG